jgi:hypothetical protein
MGNKTRKAGRIIAIFFGVIFWLIGGLFALITFSTVDYSLKIAPGIVGIIFFAIAFILSIVAGRLKNPPNIKAMRKY